MQVLSCQYYHSVGFKCFLLLLAFLSLGSKSESFRSRPVNLQDKVIKIPLPGINLIHSTNTGMRLQATLIPATPLLEFAVIHRLLIVAYCVLRKQEH